VQNVVELCVLWIAGSVVLQKVLVHRKFLDVFILVCFYFLSLKFFYVRTILAQLEIEKHYFATSLSVLEDQPMDMLLGLDMLRRHQVINSNLFFFFFFLNYSFFSAFLIYKKMCFELEILLKLIFCLNLIYQHMRSYRVTRLILMIMILIHLVNIYDFCFLPVFINIRIWR
jgi:hypothetical protein